MIIGHNIEPYNVHFNQGLLSNKDPLDPHAPDLVLMSLREFISLYSDEVLEVLDEQNELRLHNTSYNEVLVLVDTDPDRKHCMTTELRKQYKRSAGQARREKMQERYHYHWVWPRIHGYMMVSHANPTMEYGTGLHHRSILRLDSIVSSAWSNRRGIGTFMLDSLKSIAQHSGAFTDIILECSNDQVSGEDEDEYTITYPEDVPGDGYPEVEYLKETLTSFLWKMGMRLIRKKSNRTGNMETVPYYNIDHMYIEEFLEINLYGVKEDKKIGFANTWRPYVLDPAHPSETEYEGLDYYRGLAASRRLIVFYEKFGFKLAGYVNTEWKIFSKVPYPAMRVVLKEIVQVYGMSRRHEINGMLHIY